MKVLDIFGYITDVMRIYGEFYVALGSSISLTLVNRGGNDVFKRVFPLFFGIEFSLGKIYLFP